MKQQTLNNLSAISMVILACFFCACTHKTATRDLLPSAQKGVMDLRHWNFTQNGSVALKGEWEFYWKKHISPDQFKNNKDLTVEYINVPGHWNKFKIDGEKISGIGFATYRLKVFTEKKGLGLKFFDASSASRVHINGELICTSGFPALTKEQTIPLYAPSITSLENDSNILDIVIHVSNFHDWVGGMWNHVYLGEVSELHAEREKELVFSFLLFGAIWIIGFYHITLFLIRKQDKTSLLFGFICLLEGFQTIIFGERYIITIFPTMEFWLFLKLLYLSMYCAVPLFIWYMKTIFPDEISDTIVKGVLFTGSLFSAFVLFFPSRWFTMSLPMFQIFTICLIIYGAVVLVRALLNRRQGAIIFLTGFMILMTTVINDIFDNQMIIETGHFIPIGLFSFLFSQAFLISHRYSLAFSTIEQQGEALTIENNQRKIAEHHLKKNEEKYREMIELLPVPFGEFDLDFNLLYANQAAFDWFGYTKEDYHSGINISSLLGDTGGMAVIREKAENSKLKISSLELKLKKKDGSKLWGQATFSVIIKNGEPFAIRSCFVDLSEQKKSRKKLAHYQEQLRELSSQISLSEEKERRTVAQGLHDQAGQSLVLIRIMLNEIADGKSLVHPNEKLKNVIKTVDQTMNQIRDLTFDLSPPELYQFGIEFALESLCERKSKLFNIPILFSCDETQTPLNESDGILVYQSARELLFNVLKHACATKILVSIKQINDCIEVAIEDNGVGLDTNRLYSSKGTNKGFGLFSINERMHHRGGRFDIQSDIDRGTKATIILPLKPPIS